MPHLGALFWAATFISLGYFLGAEWPVIAEGWLAISRQLHHFATIIILLALISAGGYLFLRARPWRKSAAPIAATPRLGSTADPKRPR